MTTTDGLGKLIGLRRAKALVSALSRPDSGVQSALFYGAPGSGKNVLADLLAQSWLCTQPSANGACGTCSSCGAFERGRHADYLEVTPQPPSNIIRLAAIVSGDDDRISVQQFLRTLPLMGRNKVVVVRDADRMNADAANGFLKTLEEPPSGAKIILTSASPGGLLPTILSRCLSVACELPASAELDILDADRESAARVFAGGAPGRLVRQQKSEAIHRKLLDLTKHLGSMSSSDALAISEAFRGLADELEKETGTGVRGAVSALLEDLAIALRAAGTTDNVPAVVEAHRRIIGNGSATLVLDDLFANWSSPR